MHLEFERRGKFSAGRSMPFSSLGMKLQKGVMGIKKSRRQCHIAQNWGRASTIKSYSKKYQSHRPHPSWLSEIFFRVCRVKGKE